MLSIGDALKLGPRALELRKSKYYLNLGPPTQPYDLDPIENPEPAHTGMHPVLLLFKKYYCFFFPLLN
jgi:hypothetical protein